MCALRNVAVLLLAVAASASRQRALDPEVKWWLEVGDRVEVACTSALSLLDVSASNASTTHSNVSTPPAKLAAVKDHGKFLKVANSSAVVIVANHSVASNSSVVSNQTANKTNHTFTKKEKLQNELSNLKNLFSHIKGRIGALNKNEKEGVDVDAKMIKEQEQIIKTAESQLNWTNISASQREMRVNRTRSAKVELKYWQKHRELSHGSFHSNLKMSHGLMDKLQSTMKIFHQALEGKTINKMDLEKIKRGLPSAKAMFLEVASLIRRTAL